MTILLIECPKIVESTSFTANKALNPKVKKSGPGFLGKVFNLFRRDKKKDISESSSLDLSFAKNNYDGIFEKSETEDTEISKTQNKSNIDDTVSDNSLEPPYQEQSSEILSQDKNLGSEESKSAPPPSYGQLSEEIESTASSGKFEPEEPISIYEDYENNETGEFGTYVGIPEESENSKVSEIEEEQKQSTSEHSEPEEESAEADILGPLDSQIPEEISMKESSSKSVHSSEASKLDTIGDEKENEESEKPKSDTTSGEENHYDASYDSNLEETEKSISNYRNKFSENFSDELPHETYDRLLNEALNHESQADLLSEKENSLRNEDYSGSENVENSETLPKEASGIENYLEDTVNSNIENSEASTADPEEREIINLNEESSKYASQNGIEEEPEDLEDFLVGVDIKAPTTSEYSMKSHFKSENIPTEYDRERSKTVTQPVQKYEQEQEQGSESDKESEREFDEVSKNTEESTKPSEKSTGFMSRFSNSIKNFMSSFGSSKREPSVSKEESIQIPFEETQEVTVRSPEKKEIEESEELPETNKNRVKMLIEHFERENALKMPTPIDVPRNKLGLRDTESTTKKNVDNLINFFEAEDIKAKEEARRYQETKKKREMARVESSFGKSQEASEEDLEEFLLENTRNEESPESGEEREGEIMKAINGEPLSEVSEPEPEPESSTISQNFDYDESQEELSLPAIIPSIDEQDELAGGLIWALGVGKYVCNPKNDLTKFISSPLSSNVLVSAPSQEQITKLLQLSGGEASEMIMDLVSSVLTQN